MATVTVTGLTTGTALADQQANTNAIQAAITSAAADDTVVIPPGTWQVYLDPDTYHPTVDKGLTVNGYGATLDCYPKTGLPWNVGKTIVTRLFNVTATNATVRFQGFTAIGPTEEPPDGDHIRCIDHQTAGQTANFYVKDLTITGQWTNAVTRSGLGFRSARKCHIEAHESSLGWFEGQNSATPGRFEVVQCTLKTPNDSFGEPSSSVAIYVNPHIPGIVFGTTFQSWERFGLYRNGSSSRSADVVVKNSTFTDCALMQSTSSGETTFIGCTVNGTDTGGITSSIKGKVNVIGLTQNLGRWIGWVSEADKTWTTFRDCNITSTQFFATGNNVHPNILMDNVVVTTPAQASQAWKTNSTWNGIMKCVNVRVYDYSTTSCVQMENSAQGMLDVTGGLTIYTNRQATVAAQIQSPRVGTISYQARP